MTISAMKQALEALDAYSWEQVDAARTALRQAIAEAEKQKPVAIGEEWKPCVKLPIVVHVREQRKGEAHVSTREGITPVKEDDLIMRGVAGEEYPISRELFNRTYTFDTAPVHAIDISQERVDETAKDRHKTDCKKDFDLLFEANSADIEALQDAQFTLEAIKSADPGTHDEIIDASLHLIKLALSNSVFGPIERIAERYGVEI